MTPILLAALASRHAVRIRHAARLPGYYLGESDDRRAVRTGTSPCPWLAVFSLCSPSRVCWSAWGYGRSSPRLARAGGRRWACDRGTGAGSGSDWCRTCEDLRGSRSATRRSACSCLEFRTRSHPCPARFRSFSALSPAPVPPALLSRRLEALLPTEWVWRSLSRAHDRGGRGKERDHREDPSPRCSARPPLRLDHDRRRLVHRLVLGHGAGVRIVDTRPNGDRTDDRFVVERHHTPGRRATSRCRCDGRDARTGPIRRPLAS
jgi:hypothetical protein